MLLAPSGAAALVARRVGVMMLWATLFGALSVYLGLLASYHFRLAAGSAIVLTAVAIFFAMFVLQHMRTQLTSRAETALE
jgi:ABC-type Mn2+/Zn2+ transport system permease subunit